MNKQEKFKKGRLVGCGIQWTDFTHNFTGGCLHDCKWTMPDGSVASCYAKDVAIGVARRAYPEGFEAHYWHPGRLEEPLKYKDPARIFGDSMSDLFGHWVPDEQVEAVLNACRKADWHSFQFLTKNAPRLLKFDFPPNVWGGASSPPDFMWGKELDRNQQERMLHKILATLTQIKAPVKWMSVEPLSWDVAPIFKEYDGLEWAVIGAATNGPKVYQPDPEHVANLLEVFDDQGVPVFFKGNLMGNPAITKWREYFPGYEPSLYMGMELGPHAVPVELVTKKATHNSVAKGRLH